MATSEAARGSSRPWLGGDWQEPPRSSAGVALCGACRVQGRCRLGIETEQLQPDNSVVYSLSCPADSEGGPDVAHGGWTAGVLDEVVGHVPLLRGQLAVTGQLSVRFVRPVPIERPLIARAELVRQEGSRWYVDATLRLAATGADLATAQGVLVARDRGHFQRHQNWLAQQDAAAQDVVKSQPD